MFKSKFKFLIMVLCFSVFILGSTLIFCAQTQNLGGDVSVFYDPPVDFLTYELNSAKDGWKVSGYDESKRAGRTDIVIPDDHTQDGQTLPVTEVVDSAFRQKTVFTSLKIGENVTTIGDYAFSACSGLTGALTIPENVTNIGEYTFGGCGFTGTLIISEGVTTIGDHAFTGCSGLSGTLTIPSSVTSIGPSPFTNCKGFTKIYVDKNNNNYTSRAKNNTTECNVIIEKGTKTIVEGFSISTIPADDSVTIIGSQAFSFCDGLNWSKIIPNNIITIRDQAFSFTTGTGELIIPDSVTSIGKSAFNRSEGFTSAKIGANVSSIGSYAFSSCKLLNDVIIDSPTIYKAVSSSYSSNEYLTYYIKSGGTIKVLQSADDGTNSYLNGSSFTKSTTTINGKSYNVYTKK